MSITRTITPIMLLITITLPGHAALSEYTSFTASDSAFLAGSAVDRFVWKTGFESPYVVLLPQSRQVKGLLVLLHGAGDNPTNFSKIVGRLNLPSIQHVLPRAPFPMTVRIPDPATGHSGAFAGYAWLDEADGVWTDYGAAFSAFLLGRIIEQVLPSLGGESPALVLLGFRQAAGIAALWAAANPGRVRGLILVSGYADPPVREALRASGLDLRDVPCLVLVGTQAADALDSGDLGVRVRELGAAVESRHLARGADFGGEDYPIVREFVERCAGIAPAPGQGLSP
ncbi:MAG: hypothetical protein MUE60_07725 [Candidatus Eisenbacteria bacterium]|jgi:predicted esterase|nr:hypothetical protein [Candidatus Eisenbacteria bacterium]